MDFYTIMQRNTLSILKMLLDCFFPLTFPKHHKARNPCFEEEGQARLLSLADISVKTRDKDQVSFQQ